MKKVEVKVFMYNAKGNYLNHVFMEAEEGTAIYNDIDSKPRKVWDANTDELQYRYVTSNLNTDKEYASEKFIKERHRIYFYALDPNKKSIELEFTKNIDNIIDRMLISRKLAKHRCLHHFENKENNVFDFGKVSSSFDKIYYITDVLDDIAAGKAILDDIDEQAKEVRAELAFLERMMDISKEIITTSPDALEDRIDVAPHDVPSKLANIECPVCGEEFNKGDNIHSYSKENNDVSFCCPKCKSVVNDDIIIEEIIPRKGKGFFKKALSVLNQIF